MPQGPSAAWYRSDKASSAPLAATPQCCCVGSQVESFLQTLCEETEIAELELKVRHLGRVEAAPLTWWLLTVCLQSAAIHCTGITVERCGA